MLVSLSPDWTARYESVEKMCENLNDFKFEGFGFYPEEKSLLLIQPNDVNSNENPINWDQKDYQGPVHVSYWDSFNPLKSLLSLDSIPQYYRDNK